ncbi:hypothetical protein DSLASN_04370 [Desulfoluna limicola]|uniref:Secreted protein n=1 Tax=Desulfoluna limicola TaxID=2810562 RepID=A0ABM7PCH5_9BACT|nr:hypothetical protein [Desulfoluna limicola]BCS94805.1 hypothetical protein DSLASN_04370 [Desulfoluna limicola]
MKKLVLVTGMLAIFLLTLIPPVQSDAFCGCAGYFTDVFRIVDDVDECRCWGREVTIEKGIGP